MAQARALTPATGITTSPSPGDSLVRAPAVVAPTTTADLRRRVARLLLLRTIVVSVVLGLSLWLLVNG